MKKGRKLKPEDNDEMTLKRLIADRDFTQEQFADLIGVSRAMLFSYFNGSKRPSVDKLVKMAKVLRVSFRTLVTSLGFDVSDIPMDEETKHK